MKILVLCTGNSARSQIAEGLFCSKAGDRIEVSSAGTNPTAVKPLAVEVMKEIGVDISGQRSKDVRIFENQKFDYVITVCDRAKETCPVFPGSKMIHWSIPDPQTLDSFRAVRDELSRRIESFLKEHQNR
jgi:arsenate reductase